MRLLSFLLLLVSFACSAQDLTVMTYNIRYDNPRDGDDNWHKRKEWLVEQVKSHNPDVLGIQEGLHQQVTYLDEQLSDYTHVGVGRDDGKEKGEYSAIYYKRDLFEVKESGTFWLSETPDEPSKGWDADIKRVCTYALLKDINSGKEFWVFNTHYDHKGKEARKQSSKLALQKIEELNTSNSPVVFMGDFNATADDQPIITVKEKMQDSFDVSATKPFGPSGTNCGFDASKPATNQIDYIFVWGNLKVKRCGVISEEKNMRHPSDHFPVLAEITLE